LMKIRFYFSFIFSSFLFIPLFSAEKNVSTNEVLLIEPFDIREIVVTDNSIIISFSSTFNLRENVDFVDEGLALKAFYYINVYKKGWLFFPDPLIKGEEIVFHCKKDIINNGYELNFLYDRKWRSKWFYDKEEVIYFISNISNYRISLEENLVADSKYYIELQMKIVSLELFAPLGYVYNLVRNWNYTSKKVRTKPFNKNGILDE